MSQKETVPVALAPMAGYTDKTFRALCVRMGCTETTTEMFSAKGFLFGSEKTESLLRTSPEEPLVRFQLFGREPEVMREAAKRVYDRYGDRIASFDINMGCPAPKITGNGEGSALLDSPALCGEIAAAVKSASPLPVTVKLRLGRTRERITYPEVMRALVDSGVSMITLHARTADMGYSGRADRDAIRKAVEITPVPVMGNGDVICAADALSMLEETGCAGVAVGRGALGNPWIFAEIRAALAGRSYVPPTGEERVRVAMEHLRGTVEDKGPHGMVEMRKHLIWYCSGIRGAGSVRTALVGASTPEEAEELLRKAFGCL